jgi:hypothetical protein
MDKGKTQYTLYTLGFTAKQGNHEMYFKALVDNPEQIKVFYEYLKNDLGIAEDKITITHGHYKKITVEELKNASSID